MELIELMKRLTGELCGTANQIQIQFNSILWEWMELIELDWFVFGAAQGNSPVKSIMNEVNNWWAAVPAELAACFVFLRQLSSLWVG